ncbi:hypothetical protein ELS19_19800 [Halogeometricum borinquense]|uniref:Uncharacterized protein n=1 Tax=Halogeometricum borinquense TaxID=60847 RepID=A0A482T1C1_9EURY|nr:hypothetical protein [Halogeometricum borinquense]RYJ07762.1 hypothetical protein ELS19_19800 [Halogeometricum borinquense]
MMLQACGIDGWFAGNWMSCIFQPIVGQISTGLFALLVVGTVLGAFYLASGSIAAPSTALILISGFAVPLLPGAYRGVAYTVMLLGLAGAILSISKKWVLR